MMSSGDEEDDTRNEHRIWEGLSSGQATRQSTVLPRLMAEIMAEIKAKPEEFEGITFPSNYEWRTALYLKMLAKQREKLDAMQKVKEEGVKDEALLMDDLLGEQRKREVLHDWNIIPSKKKAPYCAPEAARLTRIKYLEGPPPITWTVGDIAKCGKLLCAPPKETGFDDEQEMRRVYTLIYDVYRYKTILSRALKDVNFLLAFPHLKEAASRVWLLLFDLYHRSFRPRTEKDTALANELFVEAGLQAAEDSLWSKRVALAASISRMRIQSSALKLSQLLPHHLRDEKVTAHGGASPVTCWVNAKKVKSQEDLSSLIEKHLNLRLVDQEDTLNDDCFQWDPHCPQFIIFHPTLRTKLAQSSLVRKHKLIVQDRSFCLGPATFLKLVNDYNLSGTVIQSHVNSPRTTAYLASILSHNDHIKKLLAFSAGTRKKEYETYFADLGLKNVLIFSERLIDVPSESSTLEEVVAVFATPPNSYSAVADPIDLVCSRGGDLSMLEILTETEDTPEGRERVRKILEEQKETLKYAMSRPQIQFVLYETHSEIDSENSEMVKRTVSEINRCAKLHHAAIQGKLKQIQAAEEAEEREINNNLMLEAIKSRAQEETGETAGESDSIDATEDEKSTDDVLEGKVSSKKAKLMDKIVVPDCDIFDVPEIPDLCTGIESCNKLVKEGCYLALMQRKQVTRMDNKYMIEMAETRGLFGNEATKRNTKPVKKKKVERVDSPLIKNKKRAKDIEFDRIAAPTYSSAGHSKRPSKQALGECEKSLHNPRRRPKVPQPRLWWTEAARHIAGLRRTVHRRRRAALAAAKNAAAATTGEGEENGDDDEEKVAQFVDLLIGKSGSKVDEILAKSGERVGAIPVYPRLRLTRDRAREGGRKVEVPVHVTYITFPVPVEFSTGDVEWW